MKKILGMDPSLAAGILLALAAVAGLVSENLPSLSLWYDDLLLLKMTVGIEEAAITKPLLLWINDGLMAIFFVMVALEIKREVMEGALASWSQAALPVYGAIGGIIVPSLIFLGIIGINSAETRGWAIPSATDIAFALGVLNLFGSRVPASLKTFLLTLAVVDDLAAIVIIAVFYTSSLSIVALSAATLCLIVLALMNVRGVSNLVAYFLVGGILWVAVLKSGVHATLAGVALGFAIPLAPDYKGRSRAKDLEHDLHPLVSFFILPIFAFANAGVPLIGISPGDLLAPLSVAVAAGLFLGKQLGVLGAVVLVVKLGLASRSERLTWPLLYGVSCLAGIGFTMSLFIGGLAFDQPEQQNMVRIGVLIGSTLSGILGATVIGVFARRSSAASG